MRNAFRNWAQAAGDSNRGGFYNGRPDVVTSDDQKLGTVIASRDDCAIVETGTVFKSKHAIPREFLHEHDGVFRATVTKDVVNDSPKVDPDNFDVSAVREHYGLDGTFEVSPDPDGLDNAETAGARAGVQPAPRGAPVDTRRRERPVDRRPA